MNEKYQVAGFVRRFGDLILKSLAVSRPVHMDGPGIVKRWVVAGWSQADYIHLTGEGYRLIGRLIFDQMERISSNSYEQTGQDRGDRETSFK
jgi:hypothetical protein